MCLSQRFENSLEVFSTFLFAMNFAPLIQLDARTKGENPMRLELGYKYILNINGLIGNIIKNLICYKSLKYIKLPNTIMNY